MIPEEADHKKKVFTLRFEKADRRIKTIQLWCDDCDDGVTMETIEDFQGFIHLACMVRPS